MENPNRQENADPIRSKTSVENRLSADRAFQAGQISNGMDKNRRKFLTVILIGSGAFLVEKILTPLFSRFLNNPPAPAKTGLLNKTAFGGFQIAENKKSLSVYDSSGEEILQIDREA